jgi:hypothetical protein
MLKEPRNTAKPIERITPLKYIGFLLILNGPLITSSRGFALKAIPVLFLFNSFTDQIFKESPRKIKINPKTVNGKVIII